MKVLYVSCGIRGNTELGIIPFVYNQGESLKNNGVYLDYFSIRPKKLHSKKMGVINYLRNIISLRYYLKKNHYDIIHAHYSFSGIVASFAGANNVIVSFMGSDIKKNKFWKFITKKMLFLWKATIVKSKNMKDNIGIKESFILPNGVNLNLFRPIEKKNAKSEMNWTSKKNIVFITNINKYRPEKNLRLAKEAYGLLKNNEDIKFNIIDKIIPGEMVYVYNAADVLLLTSFYEGSPNVIKEAMACNLPIVSTDVGDVKEIIGDLKGCFITSYEPNDVAKKIKLALDFRKRTKGRNRIKYLGLDENNVAKKIIDLYNKVLINK